VDLVRAIHPELDIAPLESEPAASALPASS
jgi:hypothetical protein